MKIGIVGAGAAGMIAAVAAAGAGADVFVVEHSSRPGMKLNITGKGRGNITNNCDIPTLIKNVPGNGQFLYSAFNSFDPADTMAFFEELGVPLKTERGNRVFPVSDRAMDISAALLKRMKELRVRIVNDKAREVTCRDGRVCGIAGHKGEYPCDRVILACGGRSYSKTGSDGSGYRMAAMLGHTVTEPHPSLVPLAAKGSLPKRLEGLSLRNIAVTLSKNGKKIYNDFGEMVFTSYGVSGPVILSASACIARSADFPYELDIDLKPALDEAALDRRILRDFDENINRDFSNSLSKLLPAKLIPVIIELSGIPAEQKVHEITRQQRLGLVRLIKCFGLEIVGTGPFDEAIVTSGGVSVKEISPKTMGSKLVPGLYFAGEIIDVDGYTGGFNLQIAWSTGMKAGLSAAEEDY